MKSTQKGGENNENYENNEKCGVYSGHCDVYHLAGSGTFIGNNNKNSKWYSYTFESRISHWESDPPKIRGSVYISVGNYKEVPGTYIGGLVRIYSSSGVLVMSGDWSYADAFPGDVAGCEWNDYYDPANTPQYSYYYSKGRVKLYNGNGYNYYDCNATPDIASNANNMMTIQKNENGEIYGSEYFLNQIGVEPDLILTCGENGVEGFVRAEDLNYDPVETLQDVITYQETRAIKEVFLFMQRMEKR